MLDFPRWQVWGILGVLVLGFLFALPNFLPAPVRDALPPFLPRGTLNLGLDLRGGSHILLEAEAGDIRRQRLEVMEETLRAELRQAEGGPIPVADLGIVGGAVVVTIRDPARLDQAVEIARTLARPVGALSAQRSFEVEVVDGNRLRLTPTEAGLATATDQAMRQAVEVIRRRVDELGTREPTIIRQGANRIVVQVPGLQDPEQLKALIGKTARLEFKLVDTEADPALAAQGRAPPGSEVLPNAEGGVTVVKRRAIVTGDQLVDAQPSFQDGLPVVSFRFDAAGGRRFGRATQENVGKPFAIILDGRVISAPRINEPILGGSGIIQGNFTTESANELAILLRSGRLPVELKVIEERTVGPDLGADSIRAGAIASLLSVVLVAAFMIATYGRFGVYSVVALLLNAMLVLAVMSALGATLTLPGIAGFVLTVGAAVDANVLINERIREELRRGRRIVTAIETGYEQARRAIVDANVTNVIAALLLFWFGSGPVKGFAVVLTIGIITSVFTAVTVTRLIVARWVRAARPAALVI
ncbi:MAG: protein translocase subunit SecD [Sphingomonadaceae bacterium]|uniref:protein translocase subunit SecD n=1 Tax=Thermaurantiacus sp. TaxID=2820283 RepID=UPI00298EDD08|nr:protein translocase subunit SecD [Thermaurantiacus sp.]MCS6986389.1 protein translocase subunit SecD [Sphingomonadaceae bacterium]MDW8414349.1 protein translocase subunit SecD [Thermaurantiacus sp.]